MLSSACWLIDYELQKNYWYANATKDRREMILTGQPMTACGQPICAARRRLALTTMR
jgi:hypothetical protein